jgi:hypothetical protein
MTPRRRRPATSADGVDTESITRPLRRHEMKKLMAMTLVVGGLAAASVAAQTKYGAKVAFDKETNFSALKTYAWSARYSAIDRAVHAQIIAAIDRQLGDVGLSKQTAGPSDVLVIYDAQRRTDVDLKSKAAAGKLPTYEVGLLIVRVLEPSSGRELFRAEVLKPISADRTKIGDEIEAAAEAAFADYPTRKGAKR